MTAEKFCFCFKLETGCVLLGLFTFALSTAQIVLGAIFLDSCRGPISPDKTHVSVFELCPLTKSFGAQVVVAGLVLIISKIWIVYSVLFIYGALRKNISYIVSYFLFGVMMSILYLLSALLEVIKGLWIPSTVTFILSVIYLKCLVSMYFAYDQMRRDNQDEQLLVTEEDFNIED